jgi:hypothetical protein
LSVPLTFPSHEDDTIVPAYTETATTIPSQLDSLDASLLGLPLTRHPGDPPSASNEEGYETWQTQDNLIRTFFSAITSKNNELVILFVSRGIISPNCPSREGMTPLIAAVDAGNASMFRCLISLGADVDVYGTWHSSFHQHSTQRTALQVAAAKGNLVLVRLLVEECGANDALIAPDGQLALRLAAEGGHREVVAYLPMRRGGEFRRWKTHHAVAMRRAKRALEKIGSVLKWIFLYIPFGIVKYLIYSPIKGTVLYCARNRHRFGGWCKRQIKAIPERTKRAAKATWRGIKRVPEACRDIGKELWNLAKSMPAAIWKALKIIGTWLWNMAKKLGNAVWSVVCKFASLVHTLVSAVITFFKEITLQDVWNAFCALCRAIFISLPKAIWHGLEKLWDLSWDMVVALFGWLGKVAWWIVRGVYELLKYIPKQLGIVAARVGSSTKKGAHEVLIWWDPKRV